MLRYTSFPNLCTELDDAMQNKNRVILQLTTESGLIDFNVATCDHDDLFESLTLRNGDGGELIINRRDTSYLTKSYSKDSEDLCYWFSFNDSSVILIINLAA